MDDEQQLYHQTKAFVQFLSSWSSNEEILDRRISQLARDMAKNDFWQWKEVEIIYAWLSDLRSVGYTFPSIVQRQSASSLKKTKRRRTAVCVTDLAECINEGWIRTSNILRNRLQSDIDIFFFLSSTLPSQDSVTLSSKLKQIRSHPNSTIVVLYEDRVIDPGIPSNCTTFYRPSVPDFRKPGYYQQMWALNECFDLVKDYQQKMNVKYELFVRARIDSFIRQAPITLEPSNNSTILIPDENHFFGYNDRFAIGAINLMEKYMRRWIDLRACHIRNIHSESFLKLLLNRYNVKVEPIKNLTYIHVPHGTNQCH